LFGREREWRYEAIASTGNIGEIAPPGLSVAKSPAKRRDVNAKISLFDERVRPHSGDQLLLANHFTWTLGESDQNIQRTAAEPHGLAIFQKKLTRRNKPKGPE
jgi:hypothetical protein